MLPTRRFAIALLLAVTPGIAAAADISPPPPVTKAPAPAAATSDWEVTLGGVVEYGSAFAGAPTHDMSFWGWPIIDIHTPGTLPTFFGGRDSASIALINLPNFKLGPAAKYISDRRESSYAALQGLGDVSWAVQAGGFAEYWAVPWLRLRAEVRQGFNGETGVTGDLFADFVATIGQWRASVGPRATFQTAAAISPYFNVTPTQSLLSGLPVYNTSGGFYSWGVGGQVDYFYNPQWSFYALMEFERISDSAAGSPIVTVRGSPDQYTFGLGISYSFTMHPLW